MSHLALGLSKRLSNTNTPPNQKRRSVNLNLSSGSGSGSGHNRRGSRSFVPPPDTPSDLTSTSDDGNVTSRTASPSVQSLRNVVSDQKTEIEKLNLEIADLRGELDARPTYDELESVRKEWATSEDLFAQSQKDNEQKHATIEHLRQYIKVLEHKLEEMLGDGWRECCPNLPTAPIHAGASFASTTPLPRPGSMPARSGSTKRASRNSASRNSASFEASRLRELRELGNTCEKTTPTSALRKLEGITETAKDDVSLRSTSSAADCLEVDGLMDTSAVSSPPKATPVSSRPASRAPSPTPTPAPRRTADRALADQVAQLSNLIKALPLHIATQINNDDDKAAERARIEEQKAAMLEMLEAAEQRADAREMRLQAMLAEAKACSGQMGW